MMPTYRLPDTPLRTYKVTIEELDFEDWSGREDLNAPEAHKPPGGLLYPTVIVAGSE